ncbi:NAD(P)-dependent oxidoreductase [Streptomyces auratus]|uniref:NAD(P)-dependent oxidoreductase n=1 Tax=Streptomyces auratus AGR0001 TaxID=1160718 RepID=A0A8B1NLW8_9ACTN|nr:NAD(P)-dependent oxidoreductase [Streptomyces auratus]QTZ94735.1 NAD(P)-dependent oxidoreductase [Streptomyces auratus AGR0001]
MTGPVAVIGLGGMGGGMARALLGAGYAVTVFNRTRERAAPLEQAGAVVASTAVEAAAGADTVLLSLADEPAVEEVLFGDLVWRLRPGTVLIDTTTVSPSYARTTATRLAASGVRRLETCVMGNPAMAAEGTLRIFVSGDRAALDAVDEVLSALSQEVRYLGGPGRASALKLALNLLLGIQTAGLAEAAAFAEAAGLERELLLDVVLHSGWRSPVLGFRAEFMRRRVYRPAAFRTALMHKDLELALDQAAAYQMELPLGHEAVTRFGSALAAGHADDDAAAVVEVPPPSKENHR